MQYGGIRVDSTHAAISRNVAGYSLSGGSRGGGRSNGVTIWQDPHKFQLDDVVDFDRIRPADYDGDEEDSDVEGGWAFESEFHPGNIIDLMASTIRVV